MTRAVALALALLLTACRSPAVTAVRIQVTFPGAFDQVRFSLTLAGAKEPIAPPALRPAQPGPALPASQDHVVYLDDERAGQSAACSAEVLDQGRSLATGAGMVLVKRREVVNCAVTFGGDGGVDGGPDASPAPDAQPDAAPDGPVDAPIDAAADLAVDEAADQAPDQAVDLAPDLEPDGPADAALIPAGCADDSREAFLDRAAFPRIAGCGAAGGATVSYAAAVPPMNSRPALCAAGWHWCTPAEVGAVPATPIPGRLGAACSWVDNRGSACNSQLGSFNQPACQGAATVTASTAGPDTSVLPCTGLVGCVDPWKLTVLLDDIGWANHSAGAAGGTCLGHLALQCASALDPGCLVTCCQD